jgi:hypothetical protein
MGIFRWFGYREQERRQAYQNWAAEHPGWTYRDDRHVRKLWRDYQFLAPLKLGIGRYAFDVFEGQWRNYISKAFTFRYAVLSHNGIGSQAQVHYRSVVLIHARSTLPSLSIRRAGLLHMIGLHRNPVGSQSKEFDQKFVIQTTDPKFAGGFLNETMMQYFLQSDKIELEVKQDVLALHQPGRLQVDSIEPCLEFLSDIATLAEAASEIQYRLKRLEETNPTATESEQISYVNDAVKPDIKQRMSAAFRAGTEAVIDEFVLEDKRLKVVKAVIKGWLQPNG